MDLNRQELNIIVSSLLISYHEYSDDKCLVLKEKLNDFVLESPYDEKFILLKNGNKVKDVTNELSSVINRFGLDSKVGMPDFIIASYLINCIGALMNANKENKQWMNEK